MTLYRRDIVGLSLTVLGLPGQAPAQPARKVYRIGILTNAAAADGAGPQPRDLSVNAFFRAVRELGYVFGEHFVTESRGSEGRPERFSGLADELVRLGVDVIVTSGTALEFYVRNGTLIAHKAETDPVSYVYGCLKRGIDTDRHIATLRGVVGE